MDDAARSPWYLAYRLHVNRYAHLVTNHDSSLIEVGVPTDSETDREITVDTKLMLTENLDSCGNRKLPVMLDLRTLLLYE